VRWARVFGVPITVLVLAPLVGGAVAGAETDTSGPPRVLLVGDSITANYQEAAVAQLRAKGYDATGVGVRNTGLLDQGICDGGYAATMRRRFDPDVVVLEYTGNYGFIPACVKKTYGSKPFFNHWRGAAQRNAARYSRNGARIVWVLPPMPSSRWVHTMVVPQIDELSRALAGKRGEAVADAWTAFGGPSYNPSLHTDGLHLNDAGVATMANLVVQTVG
jgi:lysophospholipase L1-like esterase